MDWNSIWRARRSGNIGVMIGRVGRWMVGFGPRWFRPGWFGLGSKSRGGRRAQSGYDNGSRPSPRFCQSSSLNRPSRPRDCSPHISTPAPGRWRTRRAEPRAAANTAVTTTPPVTAAAAATGGTPTAAAATARCWRAILQIVEKDQDKRRDESDRNQLHRGSHILDIRNPVPFDGQLNSSDENARNRQAAERLDLSQDADAGAATGVSQASTSPMRWQTRSRDRI